MNQSELEPNTCNRRQAWENTGKQVAIGMVLLLIQGSCFWLVEKVVQDF